MPFGDPNEVEDVMAHLHEPTVSALPHRVKNNLSPWTCHQSHLQTLNCPLASMSLWTKTLSLGGGPRGTFLIFKMYLFFIFGCAGSVAVSWLSLGAVPGLLNAVASLVAKHRLNRTWPSAVVVCRLSCSMACGTFPELAG